MNEINHILSMPINEILATYKWILIFTLVPIDCIASWIGAVPFLRKRYKINSYMGDSYNEQFFWVTMIWLVAPIWLPIHLLLIRTLIIQPCKQAMRFGAWILQKKLAS